MYTPHGCRTKFSQISMSSAASGMIIQERFFHGQIAASGPLKRVDVRTFIKIIPGQGE
jgi:hypothetical protein